MNRKKSKIIAIDFDGTCVSNAYPKIGHSIGAEPILQTIIKNGYKLILWTIRDGKELLEAINWFEENNIPLTGVNICPGQNKWSLSLKAYADCYIDDRNIGQPLIVPEDEPPFVDWKSTLQYLYDNGLITIGQYETLF